MPIFEQCCCGCTLQTGTLIIGWVEIVWSILSMSVLTEILSTEKSRKNSTFLSTSTSYSDKSSPSSSDELDMMEIDLHDHKTIVSVLIGIKLIMLIAAILLIVGANKFNKTLLLPYLIVEGIHILLQCLIATISLVGLTSSVDMFTFATFLAIYGLWLYLYLNIVSFYQECKERETLPISVVLQPINSDANQPMMSANYQVAGPQYAPPYPPPPAYPSLNTENCKLLPPTAPVNYYPTKN